MRAQFRRETVSESGAMLREGHALFNGCARARLGIRGFRNCLKIPTRIFSRPSRQIQIMLWQIPTENKNHWSQFATVSPKLRASYIKDDLNFMFKVFYSKINLP